jgi:hypothetical protein
MYWSISRRLYHVAQENVISDLGIPVDMILDFTGAMGRADFSGLLRCGRNTHPYVDQHAFCGYDVTTFEV